MYSNRNWGHSGRHFPKCETVEVQTFNIDPAIKGLQGLAGAGMAEGQQKLSQVTAPLVSRDTGHREAHKRPDCLQMGHIYDF